MDINQIDIQTIVSKVMASLNENPKTQTSPATEVPKRAKVAVLTQKEKIEIKEFEIPEINDDEVLVKVEGCGVCGTDVHEYKNDPFNLIPVVLGHEGTGTIVKIGKNIKHDIMSQPLNVGDKIVTSVTITKEDTFSKMHPEKANLSDHMEVYGLLPDDAYRFNGWFGEYIILRKDSSIFKVNDMSLKERLLIEPAAVTIHAVERAKTTGLLKFNSMVLVQGCGPIGLMLLSVLRTMGIENILAVDGDEQRLQMAKRLGAKYTFNFKEFNNFEVMLGAIHKTTNGGVDFAFQCTGVPSAASSIYKMVRRGGGLCEVGFFVDNGDATINPHFDLCQKEITVVGSWVYTFADYATTLDFIRRAKGIGLPIETLVTHEFGLEALNEAMQVNMRLEGIKVAFVNK
ncbi:MAG: theronine dehydrogenase [Firmicutes bacterium HGW-Firmicutes-2]|jgi:L-iditol 2-dehydrogenase|nr:MAG: theronine dehydrogenase [Firmicutes bacterium HGW-Firmicutes-2]